MSSKATIPKSAIEESSGDQEEAEWVLDSLIGFLKGPLWNEPLFAFLDEKSVVFDPEDDPSNQDEYRNVFKEYKSLIDHLLESHMKELTISKQQFANACQEAEGVLSAKLHRALFEQIWAANDFIAFKRMMIQINIDLQLWALEVLAVRYGVVPDLFVPEGTSIDEFLSEDDFFLQEAKRRSILDVTNGTQLGQVYTNKRKSSKPNIIEVQASVNRCASTEPVETAATVPKHVTFEPEVRQEKEATTQHDDQERKTVEKQVSPIERKIDLLSLKDEGLVDEYPMYKFDLNAIGVSQNQPPSPQLSTTSARTGSASRFRTLQNLTQQEMDPDEIKHRQEYLRRQRDKLLNLKRQEREKQLAKLEDLQRSGRRPPTAKYMKLEAEAAASESGSTASSVIKDDKSSQDLAYMRSLAARIKAEVLDGEEIKPSSNRES